MSKKTKANSSLFVSFAAQNILFVLVGAAMVLVAFAAFHTPKKVSALVGQLNQPKANYSAQGTVAKTSGQASLTGTNTKFTTQLQAGDRITVPGGASETKTVTAIASDTSLTVNSAWGNTASGQTMTVLPKLFSTSTGSGNSPAGFYITDQGGVAIGSFGSSFYAPGAKLDVFQTTDTLANLQSSVQKNSISLTSTFTGGNALPGIVWYTTDNNCTQGSSACYPKAGIWAVTGASSTALVFGSANTYGSGGVNGGTFVFGVGEGSTTPAASTLRGPAAAGTNIAGANLTFDASNGTGTGGSGALVFRTAPTGSTGSTANTLAEVMRVTPNGRVGVGTTAPGYKLDVTGTVNSDSQSGAGGYTSSGNYGGTGTAAYFPSGIYSNGSNNWIYGTVNFNGQQYDTNAGTTRDAGAGWERTYGATGIYSQTYGFGFWQNAGTYIKTYGSAQVQSATMSTGGSTWLCNGGFNIISVCSSDARLKENIRYLNNESALGIIRELKPARFDWKPGKGEKNQVGFIAQDVLKVLPDLVHKNPNDGYYEFSNAVVVPYTVKGLQEVDTQFYNDQPNIDRLKEQVDKLEKELETIKLSK